MRRPRRGALAAVVAAVVLAAVPARAQSPTEDMQRYTDEVARLIRDVSSREKDTLGAMQASLRRLAFQVFGAQEAAHEALGRHWEARTPLEREDFTRLFAELLEATYLAQVDTIGGGEIRIRYLGELIEGDRADVRARVSGSKGREAIVDAHLVRRGERWYVYDVAIDGISLIGNYRAQFDRVIRRSSYPELVRQVTAKRDELLSHPRGRRD